MRTSKNKISTMWAGGVGAHGMRPDDSHNAGALADAQRAHAVRPYTPSRDPPLQGNGTLERPIGVPTLSMATINSPPAQQNRGKFSPI